MIRDDKRIRSKGVVLLFTIVMLVVLAIISVAMTISLSSHRHRINYMKDYQAALYACDSAIKFTLDSLQDINIPDFIGRPNEPDFSDVFDMNQTEYERYIENWVLYDRQNQADQEGRAADINEVNDVNDGNKPLPKKTKKSIEDINLAAIDMNDIDAFARMQEQVGLEGYEEEKIEIPGPYGPPWPAVSKPQEFEIGSAKVTVTIEDENAKYPIVWQLIDNPKIQREIDYSLYSFWSWFGKTQEQREVLNEEREYLLTDMDELKRIKPYKLDFQEINKSVPASSPAPVSARRRSRRSKTGMKTVTTTVEQQISEQAKDISILLNNGMIDLQTLSKPYIETPDRKESILKYISLYGSRKVNINSAPRHVLEAAFAFGGDAPEIARAMIERRKIEPFKDLEDLKKSLFRYSDSIKKCEDFITAQSDTFTIRVKAVSGVAESAAVIAVKKAGNKFEKLAVIKK